MDYLYAHLSLSGHASARRTLGNYYNLLEKADKEPNPYRVGMTQACFVADSDDEAEERYSEGVEYFYEKCLYFYPGYTDAPGYRTQQDIASGMARQGFGRLSATGAKVTWKDRIESGAVIAGKPADVTERLRETAKELGVGHMMLLMQLGSVNRENTMHNVKMMGEQVLPHLRDVFSEWEDKWWIKPLASERRASLTSAN
jgi:alkanesulfonate monooxygenase SsuD/methylene tetrahydromethanopterin reductase-like flavin-dependent oxidoreductase (luciferase family)